MARRRRPSPPERDDEVPDWFWGFTAGSWFMRPKENGEHESIAAFIAARRRWSEARNAWLEERKLVVWGMRGLSWQEFKRIQREEPHRVVRRPER